LQFPPIRVTGNVIFVEFLTSGLKPTFFFRKKTAERVDGRTRNVTEPGSAYKEEIWKLAEPVAESLGMEVIQIECVRMKSRWIVRVYLDKDGGVTLDDCSRLSGQLGDVLAAHDLPPGPYTLEVSSPGPDRPLGRDKDFVTYIGQRIRIRLRDKLEGTRHFRGKLVDFIADGDRKVVVLEVGDRKVRIPRESVWKANLDEDQDDGSPDAP